MGRSACVCAHACLCVRAHVCVHCKQLNVHLWEGESKTEGTHGQESSQRRRLGRGVEQGREEIGRR